MFGDGTPPPKTLNWPKPASSSRISKTFGAPLGGRTTFGKVGGSESSNVRPTLPGKWKSGRGSEFDIPGEGDGETFSAERIDCVMNINATTATLNAVTECL